MILALLSSSMVIRRGRLMMWLRARGTGGLAACLLIAVAGGSRPRVKPYA
jgi:hypothetical protein